MRRGGGYDGRGPLPPGPEHGGDATKERTSETQRGHWRDQTLAVCALVFALVLMLLVVVLAWRVAKLEERLKSQEPRHLYEEDTR